MKKQDVIDTIEWIINNDKSEGTISASRRVLSYLEDIGMLPPPGKVELLPDPQRPGKFVHGEIKREWDDEEK